MKPAMLKELKIRNFAIIDDLSLRFDEGMNVLTGETGAGKSIIVDALGIALGGRAQADLVRSGEKEAVVQAVFEAPSDMDLPDIGIDLSEGIIIRRVISSGGKSRSFLNDSNVTLQSISDLGANLVDMMSQHEHQGLLKPERQRALLDAYGRTGQEREGVRRCFAEVRRTRLEYDALLKKSSERVLRMDLLRFQVQEIAAAGLSPAEKRDLEEERRLLTHMARLNELSEGAYGLLYADEGSITEQLAKALAMVREMRSIDEGMTEALGILESAGPLIDEAALSLRDAKGRYDLDPRRLDAVEERLEQIRKLERKYGEGIEAILAFREEASRELSLLESSDERLAVLADELHAQEGNLRAAAESLSAQRSSAAAKLEKMVAATLRELAIPHAGFRVAVTTDAADDGTSLISEDGMDRIEFLFSANAGEPLKPLARIASGGELSRVMLSLKSILSEVDRTPVLIFDEIDAGIGGKTAESVGRKLSLLAKGRQLLCITHLAQIARYADRHLRIEKRQERRRVTVEVKELTGRERQDEIARMLSGEVTDISRRHAEELLERT